MSKKLHDGFWLGVDVAKAKVDVSVAGMDTRTSEWARLPVKTFSMNQDGITALAQWIESMLCFGPCRGVCMESTGIYSLRFVESIDFMALPEASIINPALAVAFRKSIGLRDKCDRVDAAVLALYGVVHRPRANAKKDEIYMRLRALWRLHEDVNDDLLAWNNRLEQTQDDSVREILIQTINHLEEQAKHIWKQMKLWIAKNESLQKDAKLIQSIPGVGEKITMMVLSEYGDLRLWRRNQVIAYAGLYPKVFLSGDTVALPPRLARGGGARIRKTLYMPACGLMRMDSAVARWGSQLRDRGKSKMCSIGAMMRKQLLVIRGVVVSGKKFQDNHVPTPQTT